MAKNMILRIIFISTVIIFTTAVWPVFFIKNFKKIWLRFFFFFIFILYFVIDRLTKYIVINNMSLHDTIPVLNDVFHITYIRNYGAAFGFLQHKLALFVIVAFLSVFMIFFYAFSKQAERIWTQVALGALLGGALGNLYDRIFFGYVIDFLDFRLINFPIFNFADVVIDIGIIMLFYEIIFMEEKRGNDVSCIV
ncbi:MAG: signal peptidase II [Candidatus Muiribacteriota bacterium]